MPAADENQLLKSSLDLNALRGKDLFTVFLKNKNLDNNLNGVT